MKIKKKRKMKWIINSLILMRKRNFIISEMNLLRKERISILQDIKTLRVSNLEITKRVEADIYLMHLELIRYNYGKETNLLKRG